MFYQIIKHGAKVKNLPPPSSLPPPPFIGSQDQSPAFQG